MGPTARGYLGVSAPPRRIASGFGAAIEMGIAGPLGSPASKARTDAFARMSLAATRKTGTIGAGKV
jgi:hypothetical protein